MAVLGTTERSIVLHISEADFEGAHLREYWQGRVIEKHGSAHLDTTRSRFHGASIAGLVVGAMGVFVFTVALRHWLNQRRAFRVAASETVE